MKKDWDNMALGLLFGLIGPVIGMFIYYALTEWERPFKGFWNMVIMGGGLAPLISLCCISNLATFFLFLNKEKYQTVKGIIFATLLYGVVVVFLKIDTL